MREELHGPNEQLEGSFIHSASQSVSQSSTQADTTFIHPSVHPSVRTATQSVGTHCACRFKAVSDRCVRDHPKPQFNFEVKLYKVLHFAPTGSRISRPRRKTVRPFEELFKSLQFRLKRKLL